MGPAPTGVRPLHLKKEGLEFEQPWQNASPCQDIERVEER